MTYRHGYIPQQHIEKEYYTHHNNMLVHNGLAAVIYGKSLYYNIALHYIHQVSQPYYQNMKISKANDI